ncbi:MAG: hypothetical protein WD825_03645 [Gemmatimonadaceae bacterium]
MRLLLVSRGRDADRSTAAIAGAATTTAWTAAASSSAPMPPVPAAIPVESLPAVCSVTSVATVAPVAPVSARMAAFARTGCSRAGGASASSLAVGVPPISLVTAVSGGRRVAIPVGSSVAALGPDVLSYSFGGWGGRGWRRSRVGGSGFSVRVIV